MPYLLYPYGIDQTALGLECAAESNPKFVSPFGVLSSFPFFLFPHPYCTMISLAEVLEAQVRERTSVDYLFSFMFWLWQ